MDRFPPEQPTVRRDNTDAQNLVMDNDSDWGIDAAISAASRPANVQRPVKQGQSFAGVVFPEFGIATWLISGLMKQDRVLIVSNGIGVVVGLVYLMTIRYYS